MTILAMMNPISKKNKLGKISFNSLFQESFIGHLVSADNRQVAGPGTCDDILDVGQPRN